MRGVTPDLLLARARHSGSRWLLVAAGLAVAAVLPVLAQAVTAVTADAALRQGLAALPPGRASIAVSYNGLPDPAQQRALDAAVTGQLPRLTGAPIHRELIFREISDGHGGSYTLGAADRLSAQVSPVSGRMPATCTPARCEVVALRLPGDPPLPQVSGLGLVVVGEAVRTDPLLLSGTFDPGPGHPVLLADGVAAASGLAELEVFGRTFGWVAPLDLTRVRAGGVGGWGADSAAVGDELWKQVPGLVLTVPDDVLRDEDARARVGAGRFAVLGGATSVLLLGTAVVGGAALRRDHEAFLGALRRRGASRRRIAVLVVGEVGIAVGAGTLFGLVLATAAAGILAGGAGLPVAGTAGTALLLGLPSVLGLAVVAALLLGLTLTLPAGPAGTAPGGTWRAVDAVAVGCLVTAGLLAGRGEVSTGGVGGGDPLLVTLPALVLVAAGLLLARVWPAVTRFGQRHLPRRALGARLGLAAAGGRPLRPTATAALLTAAIAAAVFAGAYRATLHQGSGDQAAYAVPTTARLLIGSTLERPLDVAGPQVLAMKLPAATAHPVVRAAASVRISADQAQGVELVGLPPDVLPRISRWRAVTGGGDPAGPARRLVPGPVPAGVALPAGRTLIVTTPGAAVTVAVTAQVRAADGRERGVPLRVVPAAEGPGGAAALVGDLPQLPDRSGRPVPLRLVSLVVRPAADQADRRQHALGEGHLDLAAPTGRIGLGAVSVLPGAAPSGPGVSGPGVSAPSGSASSVASGPGAAGAADRTGGVAVPVPWQGWAAPGLAVDASGGSARLDYDLSTGVEAVQARPQGPGSVDQPLPVLTDPQTAASSANGRITLTLDGQAVSAQVVGVLPRFPTTSGRFAVADLTAVSRLVDLAAPGSGQPSELWLAAPDGPAATGMASVLAGAPFDRLDVRVQAQVAARLRADPVAGGASGLLLAGALLTLLVAAASVVLLVVAERHDDADQAYAWEADGVAPGPLRRALWWRAVAVVVPAVPAGVVAGVGLSGLTARLVAVSAAAGTPQPPLVSGVGVGWGLACVALGLAGALAVAALVAAASLREPLPVRGRGVAR